MKGEIGILLPNSFRSAWILKRAGVKERWGYRSDFRSLLLTKAVRRSAATGRVPRVLFDLVRALGIETGPLTAELQLGAATETAALNLLRNRGWDPGRPLVGIAPGAAYGHAKRWPSKRYAELAASVTGDTGAACVVLGRSERSRRGRVPFRASISSGRRI